MRHLLPPAGASSGSCGSGRTTNLFAGHSCSELIPCTSACLGGILTRRVFTPRIPRFGIISVYLVPGMLQEYQRAAAGAPSALACTNEASNASEVGHRCLRGSAARYGVSGSPSSRHAAGLLYLARSLARLEPHALPFSQNIFKIFAVSTSLLRPSHATRTFRLQFICCHAPTSLWAMDDA